MPNFIFSGPSLICCISGRKATGSLTMVSRVVVSILEVPTLTFIIYQLTLALMKSLFIVQSIDIYLFCEISILYSKQLRLCLSQLKTVVLIDEIFAYFSWTINLKRTLWSKKWNAKQLANDKHGLQQKSSSFYTDFR